MRKLEQFELNQKVLFIPAHKDKISVERVGIYARVSTAGREQLKSLAAQISGLTRHVSKIDDWLLVDVYMDVGSAKTESNRKEFNRLLNDCKNHELDRIITKSLSRFGRDNVEVIESLRLLRDLGVKIYFMEEDIDVDKNYDEFEISIRTALNQSENEHRSENIKMGLKHCAECGSSGLYKKPCFGYKKNVAGDLIPDEKQAEIVKRIFEMYLSGVSIDGIAKTLEQENIPSPKGSSFWAKKTISLILTNVKYTGNVQILKSDSGRDTYCMWDAHEAIISRDDFAQVQKEIDRRTRKKRKSESAASNLVRSIDWAEPISSSTSQRSQNSEQVRTINWPEPEELKNRQ